MLLVLTHLRLRSSQTSRVNYNKIEELEYELGIVECPKKTNHRGFIEDQIIRLNTVNPTYYDSRAFTTSEPINPTTGFKIKECMFVSENEGYPEL